MPGYSKVEETEGLNFRVVDGVFFLKLVEVVVNYKLFGVDLVNPLLVLPLRVLILQIPIRILIARIVADLCFSHIVLVFQIVSGLHYNI